MASHAAGGGGGGDHSSGGNTLMGALHAVEGLNEDDDQDGATVAVSDALQGPPAAPSPPAYARLPLSPPPIAQGHARRWADGQGLDETSDFYALFLSGPVAWVQGALGWVLIHISQLKEERQRLQCNKRECATKIETVLAGDERMSHQELMAVAGDATKHRDARQASIEYA